MTLVNYDFEALEPPLNLEEKSNSVEGVELLVKSVVGLTKASTMKLEGTLLDAKVTILIDYGLTHNFIALKIMEQLGIHISEMAN